MNRAACCWHWRKNFACRWKKTTDQHQLLKGLTHALLECARNGQRALVCLDEAQAMPLESLEVLRLLTNLETEKRKLLQVVLFGQPELNERLKHHSVRQLRQRISFQYDLQGLRRNELERYLRHRLAVAGFAGETLFSNGAVAKLHRITGGTPRLVNIVAHKALMLAFSDGRQQVLCQAYPRCGSRHARSAPRLVAVGGGVDRCGGDRVAGHCVGMVDGAAMSVINQVLNQLEQRGAHTAAEQTMVRAVPQARRNFSHAFAGVRVGTGGRDRRMAMGADTQAGCRSERVSQHTATQVIVARLSVGQYPGAMNSRNRHLPASAAQSLMQPVRCVVATLPADRELSFELSSMPLPSERSQTWLGTMP